MQGHNDSFNFFIFNAKLKDYGEANWVGDIFVKKQRHKSRQLLMRSHRDTSKELVSYNVFLHLALLLSSRLSSMVSSRIIL